MGKVRCEFAHAGAIVVFLIAVFTAGEVWAQNQPVPRPPERGRKYQVRIESSPPGATIYRNDKKYGPIGTTPWQGGLVRGKHVIILEKDGYEPARKQITVARRRMQEKFIPMVKKADPPRIDVRADADKNTFGAQVWLDGQLQGEIPIVLKVEAGRHLLEIKKKDFDTFTQWVEVKEGEKVTVNPRLESNASGSILVSSDVAGAAIYIDGNKQEQATPARFDGILVGPHIVEVRKEPAMPWKQTVNVEAGKVVKVNAELEATMGGPGGSVRVLSNVDGARVYIDGKDVGEAPVDITAVKVGEHLIEVKAPGYFTREERIEVSAGSAAVLKLDLQAEAAAQEGTIKVVSPTPGAEVAIDGEVVGAVPQEKKVSSGDHFVVVRKPGFAAFEKKVTVEPGQTVSVTARLAAVGGLKVVSNPPGASVLLDGQVVGSTPFTKSDVDVGSYQLVVRLKDFYDFETQLDVEGGKNTTVTAKLEAIETGPTALDLKREQRSLSSFGARTLPLGRVTIDLAAGYPYYLDIRFNVGAGNLGPITFDAGLSLRSFFSRTEVAPMLRVKFAERKPFSAGSFVRFGGGAAIFDDSGRNTFFFDAGVLGTLTGMDKVNITFGSYVNIWTDRHCPKLTGAGNFESDYTAISTCRGYKERVLDGMDPADFSQDDADRVEALTGESGMSVFDRDRGIRLMLMLAIEVAIKQRWNLWFTFEGPPFQDERAAYTNDFNGTMFSEDVGTYFRLGTTYKF